MGKHTELRAFIRENKISLLAISKHKVQEKYPTTITQKLVDNWKRCSNYNAGKERLWIIWDPQKVEFTPQVVHT